MPPAEQDNSPTPMPEQKPHKALWITLTVLGMVLVGLAVWFWQQNNVKDLQNRVTELEKAQTEDSTTDSMPTDESEAQADATQSWLKFASNSGTYSLRIPDGWSLVHQTDSDVLYSDCASADCDSLTYKPGTRAIIETTTGGRDGNFAFFVAEDESSQANQRFQGQTKVGTFKAGNLVGDKYVYEQTSEPEDMGPPAGTTVYSYYFVKDGKGIYIAYSVFPGAENRIELVEQAIATLE